MSTLPAAKSISLGGRACSYFDVGQGEPLLLLHGFPFTAESWWPLLESPPAGVRVIAPTHRGFGESALGDGPATMERLAEDALALLDALGVSTAFVGGLSMGGYVAIALARLDPGRVRGLLLVDTQSLADDAAGQQRREATAVDVEKNGVDGVAAGLMGKLFGPNAAPAVKQRIEAMMRAQPRAAVAAASRGMAARTDGKDILSRYAGPCLIVVGAHDAITPLDKAKVMQELVKGSAVEVVPDAGHLVPLEQPEAFRALVERFVRAGR
ncbi:MAG: alpha/beta fold hydrolase [Myxococcaceae bacterium]